MTLELDTTRGDMPLIKENELLFFYKDDIGIR